jgi:AraC-like DNA-binding protein
MTQPVLYMQPDLRAGFMLTCPHSAHVPGGWSYPRHDHPYFEIILVLEGEQQVRLTDRTLVQRSGDLLFITPFEAHAAATPQAASFYCLHFDTDDIELRQQLCRIGTRLFRADNPLLHKAGPVLRRMGSSMPAGPGSSLSWRLEVSACLCSLFAALLDVSSDVRHDEAGESSTVSQSALQTAERLANLIEREVELGQETPLQAAMRRLGYTAGHGNAVFRQVYGMSAQHYRSKLKLRRARHLLLDATLSVQEVGERLGYASSAHFSRQFKRWTGVSPLEFRQAQSARVDLAAPRAACSTARAAPPSPAHAEPPSAPRPAQPWRERAAAS